MATRKRLALALEVGEGELLAEVRRRLAHPISPIEVKSGEAPVHAVVWKGEDVDLTRLPLHLQRERHGAPYISSSLDFSTERETGRTNALPAQIVAPILVRDIFCASHEFF